MRVRGRRGVGAVRIEEDGVERPYRRPEPLPKVSLYAHPDVLRTLRVVAAEDGVQVQHVLRRAVADYLAHRGHRFADLVTGA